MKKSTKILRCDCKNEFQDKRYGRKKRLHNRTQKREGLQYRCTSCETERG